MPQHKYHNVIIYTLADQFPYLHFTYVYIPVDELSCEFFKINVTSYQVANEVYLSDSIVEENGYIKKKNR